MSGAPDARNAHLLLLSKSPPTADTLQTPKSNVTARDGLLHKMSAWWEGISARKSPIFPTSPQLSDCFCCSTHGYFQQEGSGTGSLEPQWRYFKVFRCHSPSSQSHPRGAVAQPSRPPGAPETLPSRSPCPSPDREGGPPGNSRS